MIFFFFHDDNQNGCNYDDNDVSNTDKTFAANFCLKYLFDYFYYIFSNKQITI